MPLNVRQPPLDEFWTLSFIYNPYQRGDNFYFVKQMKYINVKKKKDLSPQISAFYDISSGKLYMFSVLNMYYDS